MLKDKMEIFVESITAHLDDITEKLESLQSFNDPSVGEFYDSVEYKLVRLPSLFPNTGIKAWFDDFGADGWDLKGFEYDCAIFSRRVRVVLGQENKNETEESES